MNEYDRKRIKNAVVSVLAHYNKPLKLPIPIKAIVKSFRSIRLVPYSRQMSELNLSYDGIRSFAGTDDAVTDYISSSDIYLIQYNDVDAIRLKSNRHRWNIAHELGHIALSHHKEYSQTKLFRNSLDDETYKKLEDEANLFAAYILVPHIVINIVCDFNDTSLSMLCGISGKASEFRTECYKLWKRRGRFEPYDARILSFYADFAEEYQMPRKSLRQWLNEHRVCTFCKSNIGNHNQHFCTTCGKPYSRDYEMRHAIMIYEGIELSETGVAVRCPVCDNEQTAPGTYCIICGSTLTNSCTSEEYNQTEKCEDILPGNARYCPHCGSKSSFLKYGYLSAWNQPAISVALEDAILPF